MRGEFQTAASRVFRLLQRSEMEDKGRMEGREGGESIFSPLLLSYPGNVGPLQLFVRALCWALVHRFFYSLSAVLVSR